MIEAAYGYKQMGWEEMKLDLDKTKAQLDEMVRMTQKMDLKSGKDEGKGKWKDAKEREKRRLPAKKKIGPSPLRRELKVEDLEDEEKGDDGFLSWRAAKAKLSMFGLDWAGVCRPVKRDSKYEDMGVATGGGGKKLGGC